MATTSTPIFQQTVNLSVVKIVPADTTTLKTLYTAGVNGSKIANILVTSTDTANKDIQLVVTISAVDYILGTVQVLLNAGNTNAVPTLSVFQHTQLNGLSFDINGNKELFLPAGAVLRVKAMTTVTTAREINVMAMGGDF